MLRERIELSTSPLPMECSTTELRQHAREKLNRPQGPVQAGGSCHRHPLGASETALLLPGKSAEMTFRGGDCVQSGRIWLDWVPDRAGRRPIHWPPNHAVARNWPTGQGAPAAVIVYARRGARRRRFESFPDDGRSGQRRRAGWCPREGFTTGSAQAGAAREPEAAEIPGARSRGCGFRTG